MDLKEMLGKGIYAVPEAARLTGVSGQRIRRWLRGYSRQAGGKERISLPLWQHDLPDAEGCLALSFRDLIEVRFVDAFLEHVSWRTLRIAAELAAEIIQSTHPFSTQRFKTDGKTIFMEIAEESRDPSLLNLVQRQYSIYEIVDPYLFKSLEFGYGGNAERWYPLWPNRRVVLDPHIAFGQPTVEGVPTYVIAGAAKAEGSPRRVSNLYDISPAGVAAAVKYEQKLAA
jgi:uncharacterized protein (DUF433 family)